MSQCFECESTFNLEDHHAVFRSQSKAMINIKINKIKLCSDCHRGDQGPHRNRPKDIGYKIMVQQRLFKLFPNRFYSKHELKQLLHTNMGVVDMVTKTLRMHGDKYWKEDIIRELMGGRLY